MRILVTGGAGFIGSNTVDRLLLEEHEVAVIDDLSTGFVENVNPAAQFFQVDIVQSEQVASVFAKFRPNAVIHLAAQMDVRVSTRDPLFDASINVLGSLNVILSAIKVGAEKVIYASTGGAVYGDPEYLPVREDHPLSPISQYGITKHTVEHYLYLYRRNYGLSFTALRYPNVFGPRQNPKGEAGVIAIFARRLLLGEDCVIFGDGSQVRDYVYVSDVVDANVKALSHGDGQVLNIGSGTGHSVNDVYSVLASTLQVTKAPEYGHSRVGEVSAIVLDATLARRSLGWSPTVTFEDGIERTVKHLRDVAAVGQLQ